MDKPSISIIIPSFNQGKYIERTLLSILKQDYEGNVQVIVSDGGSTDETVSILKKYEDKITWWSARDKGFADAVMKGFSKASGDIIGIQSSDDFYLKNAFANLIRGFEKNPDASFIVGSDFLIDLDYKVQAHNIGAGGIGPDHFLFKGATPQHGTFVRAEYFKKVGGVRSEVDMAADIDLWYRVSHFQKGHFIPDFVAAYQLHPNQRTKTSDQWYLSLTKMVESCEVETRYGERFKISETEKNNLFARWKMQCAAMYDTTIAKAIAHELLKNIDSFDDQTKKVIEGFTAEDDMKTVGQKNNWFEKSYLLRSIKKIKRRLIPFRSTSAKIAQDYDLHWWKN